MENTGNYYVINHIVMITGLTDRTIRSYIASGILQGEKINGVWHFTPEQVEAFIQVPEVRLAIRAKNKSLVYDFMLDEFKKEDEACIILDLPNADRKIVMEEFSYRINNGSYRNINFSFESYGKTPRVILKGKMEDVLEISNAYWNKVKNG
ncbi:MAG: helix-turn-helix domain-containing protein [Clostridia bacterium]|nr:helix-turn-helix domain-containing protein [Clostridia bacterium]